MLTIEMLPAAEGDCLWIECTSGNQVLRLLIDAGTPATYSALEQRILGLQKPWIDLLVITHIDADHIGGAVKLLEARPGGVEFGDVWFNERRHLDVLGVAQALRVAAALDKSKQDWNKAFGTKAVARLGALQSARLGPSTTATILSPDQAALTQLAKEWDKVVDRLGDPLEEEAEPPSAPAGPADLLGSGVPDVVALATAPFEGDKTAPNRSSIALLLAHEGRRVLLTGDGHPDIIAAGLAMVDGGKAVQLDALKVPHHGSRHNMNAALLSAIECDDYLVSSNGNKYQHPDPQAIARVLRHQKALNRITRLHFNYRTDENKIWDTPALRKAWSYQVQYGQGAAGGLTFSLA